MAVHIPGEGFFRLVDQRIGRWASTGLLSLTLFALYLAAVAACVAAIIGIWKGIQFLVGSMRGSGEQFAPALFAGVLFGLISAGIWGLVIAPRMRQIAGEIEGLKQQLEDIEGRYRGSRQSGY